MAQWPFTQAIAAGATFDPLEGWTNQYPQSNGVIKLNHRATAVGLVGTATAGQRQLMQETNVPSGGTAGQTPTDFQAPPMIEKVFKGERLSLRYRNPTGAAITIDGVIDYAPGRGK